jgi:excisionase family DNA binding protein
MQHCWKASGVKPMFVYSMNEKFVDHLTLAEVAKRLRVSKKTVTRRIKEAEHAGYGPFAKPGRTYLLTETDYQILFEAIRRCRSHSSPQAAAKETHIISSVVTIDGREREVSTKTRNKAAAQQFAKDLERKLLVVRLSLVR